MRTVTDEAAELAQRVLNSKALAWTRARLGRLIRRPDNRPAPDDQFGVSNHHFQLLANCNRSPVRDDRKANADVF